MFFGQSYSSSERTSTTAEFIIRGFFYSKLNKLKTYIIVADVIKVSEDLKFQMASEDNRVKDSRRRSRYAWIYFFYSIANGKNRTSDNEESDNEEDEEYSEGEAGNSEAESESASDMDVDTSGTSYSRNIIVLN